MKGSVFFLFLAVSLSGLHAQTRMRDVFASAPDSVFPLLTRNNRLDCIDFVENKMPARVKNRLDEVVELQSLTDHYLCLRTSERSQVEMRLLSDSLFCLVNTYEGPAPDSHKGLLAVRARLVGAGGRLRCAQPLRPDARPHHTFTRRTRPHLLLADRRADRKRKESGPAFCAAPQIPLGRQNICPAKHRAISPRE